MPSLRSSPWIRGAPQNGLARLMSRINWRISSGTLRSAAARARPPSPEQAKPDPVPADNRLRFDDHQGAQNVGCDPIEARQNEAIKIVEDKPLRRFSLQHIELVAQRHHL